MELTLQLINRTCRSCAHSYKAPEMLESTYGEFLLRGKSGALSYVNAMQDSTFSEVSEASKNSLELRGKQVRDQSRIVHLMFGLTCDPDVDGAHPQIEKRPLCPHCGCDNSDGWVATEPPELIRLDVPPVSHEKWNRLGVSERRALMSSEFKRLSRELDVSHV